MNTPFIASKLQPMPITDSLDSDRWGLADTRSQPFRSTQSEAVIHLWLFGNFTPLSPTGFMFVVYGTGGDDMDILYAWGANDRTTSMERAVRNACKLMHLDPKDELRQDLSLNIPWIRMATEIIPDFQSAWLSNRPNTKVNNRKRTTDDMRAFVAKLADRIDSNSSRAITYLSYPNEPDTAREQRVEFCLMIGYACRNQEMEAIYWPSRLWNEAIVGADLLANTKIPPGYLPAKPELWYFEEPLAVQFPDGDSRNLWRDLGWRLSAIILLPVQSPDGEAVMALHLFERCSTNADPASVDDLIPRVLMRAIARPNGPCPRSFTLEMAGIKFMQQIAPRTSHKYTHHEQQMADQRIDQDPGADTIL